MAYNPFDVFHRNQKSLFAVLTVFVMIMFVLSFGQGDFFQWLPRLIGQERGEVMARVNGSKVTDVTLGRIANNRALANEFMTASMGVAADKMNTAISESFGTASQENKQFFIQFLRARNSQIPYLDLNPEILQFVLGNPQLQARLPQMRFDTINNMRNRLSALTATAGTSKEDLDLAKTALNLMEIDMKRMFDARNGYFHHRAGEDEAASASNFNFYLWLKKADQLGIKFSDDDAKKLYLDEFHDQIDGAALAEMEKTVFSNRTNYTRDQAFKALADEFRVRVAQRVVLGRDPATMAFPAAWDAFDYYQKQCDGASYALFSVPADNYLSRVTGQPNEGEIRKLYDAYRNKEANPATENLGLREPRRITVGWIEAQGNEPYWKKSGEESLTAGDLGAKYFFAGLTPFAGTGFGIFAMPAAFGITDGALTGAYAAYRQQQQQRLDLSWFANPTDPLSNKRVELLDRDVARPDVIAGLIAAAGAPFTGANFAPLLAIERSRIHDREARARALGALLTMPSAAGSNRIGTFAAMWGSLPGALPIAAIRSELLEKVKVEATKSAAERDLLNFSKEVDKLGQQPDKKPVNDYIAKFVAERGIKFGQSAAFHDQYTLGEDPGLAPLVAKANRGHAGIDVPLQFGRAFFFDFDMMTRREAPTTKLYDPKAFPETRAPIMIQDGEPVYLAWRSGDQPSAAPASLDAAKPKIIELWRRIEARKLAGAAAEELAKTNRERLAARPDAGKLSNAPIFGVFSNLHVEYQNQFSGFEDKTRTKYFVISDVAPISTPLAPLPTAAAPRPEPFRLKPRREMPYPTQAMQDELLNNKDKPLGTTIVLNDESKDRYFVAVILDREFRNLVPGDLYSKFVNDAYTGTGDLAGFLHQQLQMDEVRAAEASALALLKAEFKVTDESEKLKEKKSEKK